MFENKTVVITGASGGIGSAMSHLFAEEKANIVVNYIQNEPVEFIQSLKDKGVQVLSVEADIRNFDEAEKLIAESKKTFGSVDVLINNAGITKDGLLMRMSEADFMDVINVNLKGAFNMTRHASNVMIKQRSGTIINIASVIGIIGNIGQANYAASKAGLIGLTRSVARELASRGVTCNAIAPGFIETIMTQKLSDNVREEILKNIPLKRYGTAQEVAQVALFLAKNPYITGQVINVDGGMVMA